MRKQSMTFKIGTCKYQHYVNKVFIIHSACIKSKATLLTLNKVSFRNPFDTTRLVIIMSVIFRRAKYLNVAII